MSAIVLLDTSVYLNVLDVPGFNQDRDAVLGEFQAAIEAGDHFLLPLASVWETGNHISHLSNGQSRRKYGQKLLDDVTKAFNGYAPYWATHFPDRDEFLRWLGDFPDAVMDSKGLADLSILKEWERTCALNPMSRVRIWSLDADLAGYDRRV